MDIDRELNKIPAVKRGKIFQPIVNEASGTFDIGAGVIQIEFCKGIPIGTAEITVDNDILVIMLDSGKSLDALPVNLSDVTIT